MHCEPNFSDALSDKFRIKNRRTVNTDFIGAGIEHATNIFRRANAAANGQGDKYLTGNLFDNMDDGIAVVMRRGNVQKGYFVGAFSVITPGNFHRVAGIANIDEFYAFDDSTVIDIQAGNNTFSQTHDLSERFGQFFRFGKVQSAFVNGAAGDGAHDAFVGNRTQCSDVIQIGNAAGSDDGNMH